LLWGYLFFRLGKPKFLTCPNKLPAFSSRLSVSSTTVFGFLSTFPPVEVGCHQFVILNKIPNDVNNVIPFVVIGFPDQLHYHHQDTEPHRRRPPGRPEKSVDAGNGSGFIGKGWVFLAAV
jgi:hypothetical protein